MAESLIPIVRNFRVRKVLGGNFGSPKRTPCLEPDLCMNGNTWVSFDLLCWNPNVTDATLDANNVVIDEQGGNEAFVKGFYRYRLIPVSGGSCRVDRMVDASLQDIEEDPINKGQINFYDHYQGISAGWKSRSNGDRLCEMIPFPALGFVGTYILEITTDVPNHFPFFPKGNNRVWKVLEFHNGRLEQRELGERIPVPSGMANLVTLLDLERLQFVASALVLTEVGTIQQIKSDNHVLVGFSRAVVAARRALEAVMANNFTHVLRLGNPDAQGRYPFYAFSGNKAVNPNLRGERCNLIKLPNVGCQDGRWWLMDGEKELFDFGLGEANARLACALVANKTYQYYCSAGLPASSFRYLK